MEPEKPKPQSNKDKALDLAEAEYEKRRKEAIREQDAFLIGN